MTLSPEVVSPVGDTQEPLLARNLTVVIFGAAVWAGGVPSNAMKRRVLGAVRSVPAIDSANYIPSGAVGRYPPSEASVMATLLRQYGVAGDRIYLDEVSVDTLATVRNSLPLLAQLRPSFPVIVCSDVFHMPRCRWLFFLYGIRTVAGNVPHGRSETRLSRWLYFGLREVAAIPWDTFLVLLNRFTVLRRC